MPRIKIDFELKNCIYDEYISKKEQMWFQTLNELKWAESNIMEKLKETLPEKMKNFSIEELMKIEAETRSTE